MACGRALLNRQDGCSIGTALSVLTHNVKNHVPTYEIAKAYKEIYLTSMMLRQMHSRRALATM